MRRVHRDANRQREAGLPVRGALPGRFVTPEADRHTDAPALGATSFEPANRDAFSPGFAPSDVTQRRQASRQVYGKTGEPEPDNLDRNFVGYIKRHPFARNASHGFPIWLVGKLANLHKLTLKAVAVELGCGELTSRRDGVAI